MEKVLVLVLRRNPETLTPEERSAYETAFQGKQVEFRRSDPTDHQAHLEECLRLGAKAVILPTDVPIPMSAMKAGVAHLTITKDGVQRLADMKPVFSPFPAA